MPKTLKKSEKTNAPRIIALDLLRGYFLVSIILNHLQWYPNLLDWVAARGTLLVSAAEGFFMISGILLGIVRGRKLADQPFRVSAMLVISRGLKLYIVAVILMLLFHFIGWFFLDNPGLKPGIRPIDQPFGEILFGALSLQYLYGWADFLRLYAIFMLISPLAMWLLRKGRWYIVIASSIALWALFPLALAHTSKSAELLMPISWQLIFFTGLVIGYHWIDVQQWWQTRSRAFKRSLQIPTLSIAAATLLVNLYLVIAPNLGLLPASFNATYDVIHNTIFNKQELPWPRLILFGLWFTLGLTIFMRFEKGIQKWFGWLLMPFGTNSLYVYILHAVIIFIAHLFIAPDTSHNIIINLFGSLLVLSLIFVAVKTRFLFKIIPR